MTKVQMEPRLGWKFPKTFWVANSVELLERAAFYGMFIALSVYLTRQIGFSDVESGYVSACFASVLYLIPTFVGAMADRIGFRRALHIAFSVLAVGYGLLGMADYLPKGAVSCKLMALAALALIIFGGAIVKPVISGTVAKCSDADHRARAFSIFYLVVNIGGFTGKTVAAPLREELGLQSINFYSAGMAVFALIAVSLFYHNVGKTAEARSAHEAWQGLVRVLSNFRFMCLILIVGGFWTIQGQLYATVPKYILRLMGEGAKPEWLANINPAVVVLLVVPITHVLRKWKPESAITVGLLIIPQAALLIALSPWLEARLGQEVDLGLFSLHPVTLLVAIGIGVIGLAECFLSPKFLEYASKQAPLGEEGLYMGYSHLTTFFSWAFGFAISGHLLNHFCPEPNTLSPEAHAQWQAAMAGNGPLPTEYAHAHYIWFVFFGIGMFAFAAMVVFKVVTDRMDRARMQ